jgi:hypothetical protein
VNGSGFLPGASVAITVRNPQTDFGPVQNFVATADQEGVLAFTITADPTRNIGSYEITANDGRSSTAASLHVVADDLKMVVLKVLQAVG